MHYFGTFIDSVSAAIRYDIEATKFHGEDAILNFPAGCNIRHSQPPVVPLGGQCGQSQPVANGSLPAANLESRAAPVPRTRRIKRRRQVSPAVWVAIRQLRGGIRYLRSFVKEDCPSGVFFWPLTGRLTTRPQLRLST
jgi:hypothetical protein